ncbi:MAG: tetratricopeptide repeat protein [Acidobacteriota bacterium]|nr:MAG: tetratricopeptide repeat protein [Acidobacteriota bacterium]
MIQSNVETTKIAQQITDIQRDLLISLKEKGPGLLIEMAVRVFKFPEDVREPIKDLIEKGLVEAQSVSGGQFGGELYSVSPEGDRVLQVIRDPSFKTLPKSAPETSTYQQQEVELLNKLGDAAREKGDLDKAVEFYQQALEKARKLSSESEVTK